MRSRASSPRCRPATRRGRCSFRAPEAIAAQFAALDREWQVLKPALLRTADGAAFAVGRDRIEHFVGVVNTLVGTLEQDIEQATSLLRSIQLALVALAIVGSVALIYLSFLFIIRPVHQLENGLRTRPAGSSTPGCRSRPGTSSARWLRASTTWRRSCRIFSYRTLESRVVEKTQTLARQNARLATLYDMTALLNAPSTRRSCAAASCVACSRSPARRRGWCG